MIIISDLNLQEPKFREAFASEYILLNFFVYIYQICIVVSVQI